MYSEDASATCGDYLEQGKSMKAASHAEGLPFAPTCHGPQCRKRSELPATPAPRRAAPERPVEHAFRRVSAAVALQKRSAWVHMADERQDDSPPGPRVERPPQ
jgi:hypothetical protein